MMTFKKLFQWGKLPQWERKYWLPLQKSHHLIPIVAAIIALAYALKSKNAHLFLFFIGFITLVVVIIFYYAARGKKNQPDKEKRKSQRESHGKEKKALGPLDRMGFCPNHYHFCSYSSTTKEISGINHSLQL